MIVTVAAGVLFVEGECPGCHEIGPASVCIGGMFTQSQLKSLDDVKLQLAAAVTQMGGNGLIRFKYGQRSKFWSLDGLTWYGEGVAAEVPANIAKQAQNC